MGYRVEKPFKNCIHLRFDTQAELCEAFMRPQEFYESLYSALRSQVFSHATFDATYPGGAETYKTDWHGFNVPGDVLCKFFESYFPNMTEAEEILNLEAGCIPTGERFYVIGTWRDDEISHELAHALWYLVPSYREAAVFLVQRARQQYPDALQALEHWLLKECGYDESVLDDEVHAYLATTPKEVWAEDFSVHADDLFAAGDSLRGLFNGVLDAQT